jgi:hypothetical protein
VLIRATLSAERRSPAITSENNVGNRFRNCCENIDVHDSDPQSIVTDWSDVQSEKQDSETTSTEAGRWMDLRSLHENALDSIRDNFDLEANEMNGSDLQFENHSV